MTACTDDERRRVAERLRRLNAPSLIAMMSILDVGGRDMCSRLADLIDPDCDPTGRGVDSIYEWCRERLEGADGAEDELYCAIMSAIEDYRHPERLYARTVRAVDRDALLALEDEMFEDATGLALISQLEKNEELQDLQSTMAKALMDYARRIREALGVSDG